MTPLKSVLFRDIINVCVLEIASIQNRILVDALLKYLINLIFKITGA